MYGKELMCSNLQGHYGIRRLDLSIKALTALVGRLFLSIGWENAPEGDCFIQTFTSLI